MNEFDNLLDIKDQKEKLCAEIEKVEQPFKDSIAELQENMKTETEALKLTLEGFESRETAIKDNFIDNWPYPELIYKDDVTGIKLQKRKSDKPEVLDMKGLLEKVLTFDELPIKKVNFDNRKLITLTEAGVLGSELVKINRTHNIAITFPKV